jgi:hypothetical protein
VSPAQTRCDVTSERSANHSTGQRLVVGTSTGRPSPHSTATATAAAYDLRGSVREVSSGTKGTPGAARSMGDASSLQEGLMNDGEMEESITPRRLSYEEAEACTGVGSTQGSGTATTAATPRILAGNALVRKHLERPDQSVTLYRREEAGACEATGAGHRHSHAREEQAARGWGKHTVGVHSQGSSHAVVSGGHGMEVARTDKQTDRQIAVFDQQHEEVCLLSESESGWKVEQHTQPVHASTQSSYVAPDARAQDQQYARGPDGDECADAARTRALHSGCGSDHVVDLALREWTEWRRGEWEAKMDALLGGLEVGATADRRDDALDALGAVLVWQVCVFVCVCVRLLCFLATCLSVCACTCACAWCMYACLFVFVCIYFTVLPSWVYAACMYVYVYTHTHTHTHTQTNIDLCGHMCASMGVNIFMCA